MESETKMNWKEIRERMGYTQQQMADMIGISRELYSMKENYLRPMRLNEALIIAKKANIDLSKVRSI